MKGDFTRLTFKKENHRSSVRMQQGRVQLDADWNEQADITQTRIETEAADLIGGCGGPLHDAGFGVLIDPEDLTDEDKKRLRESDRLGIKNGKVTLSANGDFLLTAGRYYVDGVLTENERVVAFSGQPDLPGLEVASGTLAFGETLKGLIDKGLKPLDFDLPPKKGVLATYHAYLDVWQRHITFLDNPSIREKALGGPDSATRTQTIWQVKLKKADQSAKNDKVTCLSLPGLQKSTGQLKAQTKKDTSSPKPCAVPESAGYRGLENQLYRVEIHQSGNAGTATFKWSRENGSVVARWTGQDSKDKTRLTVDRPGRDAMLGFSTGDCVELTDDTRELWGLPGVLVKLANVEGTLLILEPKPEVDLDDFRPNPKVRRWDHREDPNDSNLNIKKDGAVALNNKEDEWLNLEQGIQVCFQLKDKANSERFYRTGDYWLIPARTAGADAQSGDIDWPYTDPQPSLGIQHHYCPLAVLPWKDGSIETEITDCRKLFPPVTELTNLLYVSGDGQEAMPGQPLPHPLQVRVANGQYPVKGASVQFTLEEGDGSLLCASGIVPTDPNGIAKCNWNLGKSGKQRVGAHLLNAENSPVPWQVVYFNANFTSGGQGEGIHITKISTSEGKDLPNDSEVPAKLFSQGIQIECDSTIYERSVQNDVHGLLPNPVCFVTLYIPYPFNKADFELWGSIKAKPPVFAYQPLIVAARVTVRKNTIDWVPRGAAKTWITKNLFGMMRENDRGDLPVLAQLTLKGNFIWGPKVKPELYLDGETFGIPRKDGTDCRLHSGNGQPGGDFEMWFWLKQS